MTNKADTFQLTYRDFYIEADQHSALATSYEPRHIIRAKTVQELRDKIDEYILTRE